ncbi:MAG: ImmA/IrrE family metallo-endopeptidase [Bacteroidota bacterium]|nr:ImmA/IrrE family metallo-endopeptidase [Bacteroidota bacterium]MDE2957537.1 ImmA/IrrE family metallo-endopeptidase [Bacteroidota bacterium]
MTQRIPVKPNRIQWAREQSGIESSELIRRFPKYLEWERGTLNPTIRQLELLAKITRVPFGAFFLSEPLKFDLGVPDFRTIGNRDPKRPSPDLRDTVYLCLQRQDWYREHAQLEGELPLPFVGSATRTCKVEKVAASIRGVLAFDLDERAELPTWTDALRRFVDQADASGVLVMISGIVGSNTHRRLDPNEFRGFALADEYAPLIFVNGADSKAAQMFTLAHELAHIWLGESAVSNVALTSRPSHEVEQWCNRVAAEVLVPLTSLHDEFRGRAKLSAELQRLARLYKVSKLVVLRRAYDAGALDKPSFEDAYHEELKRVQFATKRSGGSFHPALRARVGRRFGSALVISTLAGRTTYTEAFRYLGIRRVSTLRKFGEVLGVA